MINEKRKYFAWAQLFKTYESFMLKMNDKLLINKLTTSLEDEQIYNRLDGIYKSEVFKYNIENQIYEQLAYKIDDILTLRNSITELNNQYQDLGQETRNYVTNNEVEGGVTDSDYEKYLSNRQTNTNKKDSGNWILERNKRNKQLEEAYKIIRVLFVPEGTFCVSNVFYWQASDIGNDSDVLDGAGTVKDALNALLVGGSGTFGDGSSTTTQFSSFENLIVPYSEQIDSNQEAVQIVADRVANVVQPLAENNQTRLNNLEPIVYQNTSDIADNQQDISELQNQVGEGGIYQLESILTDLPDSTAIYLKPDTTKNKTNINIIDIDETNPTFTKYIVKVNDVDVECDLVGTLIHESGANTGTINVKITSNNTGFTYYDEDIAYDFGSFIDNLIPFNEPIRFKIDDTRPINEELFVTLTNTGGDVAIQSRMHIDFVVKGSGSGSGGDITFTKIINDTTVSGADGKEVIENLDANITANTDELTNKLNKEVGNYLRIEEKGDSSFSWTEYSVFDGTDWFPFLQFVASKGGKKGYITALPPYYDNNNINAFVSRQKIDILIDESTTFSSGEKVSDVPYIGGGDDWQPIPITNPTGSASELVWTFDSGTVQEDYTKIYVKIINLLTGDYFVLREIMLKDFLNNFKISWLVPQVKPLLNLLDNWQITITGDEIIITTLDGTTLQAIDYGVQVEGVAEPSNKKLDKREEFYNGN